MQLAKPVKTGSERGGAEGRLVLVISAVLFVDTMFYAVIAPLLPLLAHQLALSKLSAGVMTAAYPFGTLVGSLPAGLLAVRVGPRFTVCTGLTLLALSTIAFALLQNAAALDAARFVEGLGGACTWSGGFAWIVSETRPQRRGAMIARALAAATAGSLFGPVIGTLATAVGRLPVFAAVAAAAALLIVLTRGLPSHHVPSGQRLSVLWSALRRPGVAISVWLAALPALASGAISVLGPLRLHRLGATAVVVGATFLAGSATETLITLAAGGISDRRGRLVPVRAGLTVTAAGLLCFTIPDGYVGLAVLIVITVTGLGGFWAPAMAMLSEQAEAYGLDQGLASGVMNLAWAGGQILGSAGAGAVAKAAGDALPMAFVAGVCAATLAVVTLTPMLRTMSSAERVKRPAGHAGEP
jgi:MFS family permease